MTQQVNETGQAKDAADRDNKESPCPEPTQAELKKSLEFTLKKLQIVGSVTRHDVLNQLTAIVGYNELLGMMVEDPKQRMFIEKEKMAIDKIRRQFKFAKDYQNVGVEPSRWQVLTPILHMAAEDANLKTIRVVDLTGGASVYADPLFEKVFSNLFENTLRHGGSATEIRISVQRKEAVIVLVVEDNGTGVATDDKIRIFERGFGKGTGWGLFLAREILDITGISIKETGEPGKGVRFEMKVPVGVYRFGK